MPSRFSKAPLVLRCRRLLVATLWLCMLPGADAVTSVHPFGVNVRATGATTVFLTFRGLDAGEVAQEAFWCGELQPALVAANPQLQAPFAVQASNPCVPGTVFGRLPLALDRARPSSSAGNTNLTDIMAIPASVARRAWQDAQAGANSAFFYVRRFSGPAGERFVIVTCRMSGGGARVPLALTEVRLAYALDGPQPNVLVLAREQVPPKVAARIRYNGNGLLRGRWEVVQPGDVEPEQDDLLTEATLAVERRAQQRRWAVVERFERFLPPTGELVLPGPDPARLPVSIDGAYKLLLRIEATEDKEGNSDTGGGRIAIAGSVAAFPMPVLRYVVTDAAPEVAGPLLLLAPGAEPAAGVVPDFEWLRVTGARWYRFELRRATEPEGAAEVLSAWVRAEAPGSDARYAPPPWIVAAHRTESLRWRVAAVNGEGGEMTASPWRPIRWP
ncbi:MAG TPA: hypothetical protein PLA97_20795 [Rubrivivax sp.]|nr:hypothetical protein [Rubrivivax sp.]